MPIAPLDVQIKTLPTSPGIYQYYDKDQKLLYVGKAKNLKKRVQSYFNKVQDNGRIRTLVKKWKRVLRAIHKYENRKNPVRPYKEPLQIAHLQLRSLQGKD